MGATKQGHVSQSNPLHYLVVEKPRYRIYSYTPIFPIQIWLYLSSKLKLSSTQPPSRKSQVGSWLIASLASDPLLKRGAASLNLHVRWLNSTVWGAGRILPDDACRAIGKYRMGYWLPQEKPWKHKSHQEERLCLFAFVYNELRRRNTCFGLQTVVWIYSPCPAICHALRPQRWVESTCEGTAVMYSGAIKR